MNNDIDSYFKDRKNKNKVLKKYLNKYGAKKQDKNVFLFLLCLKLIFNCNKMIVQLIINEI